MQPVGNTFAPSIIQPPWSSDKVKFTEDRITRRLIVEISSKRSANNLTTKWRHDQEQLSVLLSNYLYHLEKLCMFDGDAPDSAKNDKDLQTIEDVQALPEKMRKYLPGNYSCNYLPIRFTENDIEKIGSVFMEYFRHFYLDKTAEFFSIKTRVFPYPNGIISIRIVLAYYRKIEIPDKDDEDTKDIEDGLDSFKDSNEEDAGEDFSDNGLEDDEEVERMVP